jgi:quercetin dioxygenase-like cupin family protein
MASIRLVTHPPSAKALAVADVTFAPSEGDPFHKHPVQEEVIYVVTGELEHWLGREKQMLGPGDGILIPADTVHALFNSAHGETRFLAIFGPSVGETGWERVNVFEDEPWRTLRPI